MKSVSCGWTVDAGVIPERPMPEYRKNFYYTSEMRERDAKLGKDVDTNEFTELLKQVHEYAMGISDPNRVNWVRVDWVWF
jgi:hypothetical protein